MPIGRHTCVDCQTKSPETELDYSLLGLAGWRELRETDPASGETKIEWRCPECWGTYKRKTRAKTQFNLPPIKTIKKD